MYSHEVRRSHPEVLLIIRSVRFPCTQVKGFCGARVFSDRASGTVQSLTLWESWGDLETAVGDPLYAKVT